MPVGTICVRQVVVALPRTSVLEAAKLMRKHHVGNVVVATEKGDRRTPVGIVTDRDIVLEVLAQEVDAGELSLGDIVTGKLVTIAESDGVFEAIQLMRANGVRRAPVVDSEGALVGIVSVDDLLELLSAELADLVKLISREQRREAAMRQ